MFLLSAFLVTLSNMKLLKIYFGCHYFKLNALDEGKLEDESIMFLENPGDVPVYYEFRAKGTTPELGAAEHVLKLDSIRPKETKKVTLRCTVTEGAISDRDDLPDELSVRGDVQLHAWNLLGPRDEEGKEVADVGDIECRIYLSGIKSSFTMSISAQEWSG
jgi:hypothetical protein